MRIFEPFDKTLSPAQRAANEAYEAGLKGWRAAAFAEAEQHFAAAGDKPASLFAVRARRMASGPPPAAWDFVNALEEK